MPPFRLQAPFKPSGDQPQAIDALANGIQAGDRFQTLLGVTGSGKTFSLANLIERVQQPTLVISHNKTLAAQLYEEFREFFPDNAVEYFVSYYDYYQPEAYLPSSDTYIAKETEINEEIERLRHSATQTLIARNDAIVVASVSCIYGLGDPREYRQQHVVIQKGQPVERDEMLRRLVDILYDRNDASSEPGSFRARGDVLEIAGPEGRDIVRVTFDDDRVGRIERVDRLQRRVVATLDEVVLAPARHFVTPPEETQRILAAIEAEMRQRVAAFESRGKLVEAQRLRERTLMDTEMIREIGYCSGIENYTRHFSGRAPGEPPYTLLDFFPRPFLTLIDESHVTVPQLRGMYEGDRHRKEILAEFGFRLPSALDNRPLKFDEFLDRIGQAVFVSATPAAYETQVSTRVVEQLLRPTGLLDPEILVRPARGQVDDLLGEVRTRLSRNERVLVTSLTKRLAEEVTDYLRKHGIRAEYLHADVDTLDRVDLLDGLRRGAFDVLVGVNLLREGLDLPEVSLVAVLDADREGFLRSERSLIQTMGRAARNVRGQVILYAEQMTGSMQRAIDETNRRRAVQDAHNQAHGITPRTITKAVRRTLPVGGHEVAKPPVEAVPVQDVPETEIRALIPELERRMMLAAKRLEFERAAELRDRIRALRKRLERAAA